MRVELEPQPGNAVPDLSVRYSPEIVQAGGMFSVATYSHSKLPLRLFEACRIATAVINGCTVCMNWRSQRDVTLLGVEKEMSDQAEIPDEAMYQAVLENDLSTLSGRERLAVRYSQRMGTDPQGLAVDEPFWAELKTVLSDEEIVDLTYCTAAWMALGRATHVLGIDTVCSLGGPLEAQPA